MRIPVARKGFLFGNYVERETRSQYEIRQTTMDDLPGFRAMQARSWLETYPSPENGVSYEWVKQRTDSWRTLEKMKESEQFFSKVLADDTQFHRVATLNGEVVGFVHISTKEDGTKELEAIYTDPSTFGSGLGGELMRAADEWIGGCQVSLGVASYNDRAIRFYEKHGFEVVGSAGKYANKIPIVKMVRKGTVRNIGAMKKEGA